MNSDPHANSPVVTMGLRPEDSAGTIVMIHGRGASAESILSLYPVLGFKNLSAVAPQAADSTWYPHSFLKPMEMNQPYLDSALKRIGTIVDDLMKRGVRSEKIALLGFSQGACLASEFVARNARRYGALMGLSGGLIGPPGTPRNYEGSLAGTNVFLGCSDPDPHIPFERVRETETVLSRMGAAVDMRRYANMGHTINEDEMAACRELLERMIQ